MSEQENHLCDDELGTWSQLEVNDNFTLLRSSNVRVTMLNLFEFAIL